MAKIVHIVLLNDSAFNLFKIHKSFKDLGDISLLWPLCTLGITLSLGVSEMVSNVESIGVTPREPKVGNIAKIYYGYASGHLHFKKKQNLFIWYFNFNEELKTKCTIKYYSNRIFNL